MKIRFFCAGIPKSMKVSGVARFQRGGKTHFVPKRGNDEWVAVVGQVARAHAPERLMAGPIEMRLVFYMPRAKSAKRELAPLKRPDVDNLTHKLSDQFNGVFYEDDAQIVDFLCYKRFAPIGGPSGVEITIEQIMPSQAELDWRLDPGAARDDEVVA